jgi:hypothetical protein
LSIFFSLFVLSQKILHLPPSFFHVLSLFLKDEAEYVRSGFYGYFRPESLCIFEISFSFFLLCRYVFVRSWIFYFLLLKECVNCEVN